MESFWRGSGGSWKSVAYDYNYKERELLREIVRWCRKAGIPTVFWNKEDPVHFDEFIGLAVEFDHIFTTDAGCVEKYKELGKDAEVMMFAAQPSIHNPVELYPERKDRACFAGSWIPLYPERTADFERIADAISDYGLDIFDRNLNRGDPRYTYPEKYKGMIQGTLKGEEILQAYKGYRFGLNMNSVKNSETMLARRVFELMACNTPVLSNDSLALRTLFGDMAICSDDPKMVREGLDALRSDAAAYRRCRQKAMREVMLYHTLPDRVDQIATAIGLPARNKFRKVICLVGDDDEPSLIRKNLEAQTHRDLATLPIDSDIETIWKRAVEENALIVRWFPKDHHGPNFILDMAIAFFYSEAEMVTKLGHYHGDELLNDGKQFRWTTKILGNALMVDPKKVTWSEARALWNGTNVTTERKCLSIDEFNFVLDWASGAHHNGVDL
ncbi:MAG: glycosyltransferase [Methanomassiliicoccales archaeon]